MAFGLLEKSLNPANELLTRGILFIDHIRLIISQEADRDYRHSPTLHPSFVTAICELPETYHYDDYSSFINEFGTHVVVKVREALISINRTVIDRGAIFQAAQQLGLNITIHRRGRPGFNPETIPKNAVLRAWELVKSNDTVVNKTVYFSTSEEVPFVTGLRELAYFITAERILAGNGRKSEACRRITEHPNGTDDSLSKRLENIRRNIEQTLIIMAETTRSDFLTSHPKPDFLPLGSAFDLINFSATTVLPPSTTELSSSCVKALSFLGHGYDIFNGDLYAQARDPGVHGTPPLLRKKTCAGTRGNCMDLVVQSCSDVAPVSSAKLEEKSYNWNLEDFARELKTNFGMLHLLPVSKIVHTGKSEEINDLDTVKRLVPESKICRNIQKVQLKILWESNGETRSEEIGTFAILPDGHLFSGRNGDEIRHRTPGLNRSIHPALDIE